MKRARQWAVWVVAYLVVAFNVQQGIVHFLGSGLWEEILAAGISIVAGFVVADAVEEAEVCRQAAR